MVYNRDLGIALDITPRIKFGMADDDWRIPVYALTGFSDSSPDFGAGLAIKRTF